MLKWEYCVIRSVLCTESWLGCVVILLLLIEAQRFEKDLLKIIVFVCISSLLFSVQAGASSMWASCCGLLNEVMGTGAVRGQQPGFGAGAGPFRFAPTAGYSTYPPTNSTSTSLVCQACGQAFSVFRRRVGRPAHLPLPFDRICFAH